MLIYYKKGRKSYEEKNYIIYGTFMYADLC